MADHREEWEALFRKWFERLLPDPDWTLRFIPDDECASDAGVTHRFRYREATFRFRPSLEPTDMVACHEVCHVLVARIYVNAKQLIESAGDPQGMGGVALEGATEEMVEDLARAFVRAYGESHG